MNEASPMEEPPAIEMTARPDMTAAGRIGVLLVNLGTPDAPDAPSVRRYLREFLSDPRVIENQGLAWKFVLNVIILPSRPRRKALDYLKIWNRQTNESPLMSITRSQAEKLASSFATSRSQIVVDWAMRYGRPAIAARVTDLAARGCERMLIVPLYPQYCAATTATVCDEVFRVLARMRYQPTVRIVPPYYNDPAYIEAVTSSTRAELSRLDFEPDVVLASFHGLPQDYVDRGDPYYSHCVETVRLLRRSLGLEDSKLMLTFQSRFGRAQWLEPATDRTVEGLARSGVRDLAVITPGFSADCLETLEEIAVENARIFKEHGGRNFAALPCLNDRAAGMEVIRQLVLRELKGWT
jgi:ferrochelatase